MDLPVIGAHCALPTCNELDLLPIRCHCDSLFCRQHFLPDDHDCPAKHMKQALPTSRWEKRETCTLEGCENLSLGSVISGSSANESDRTAAVCPRCFLSFCATHRHPSTHLCPIIEPSGVPKNEEARALLAKNFSTQAQGASSSTVPPMPPTVSRVASKTTNPAKLAQIEKVRLMKMRRQALPGDRMTGVASVDISERLHVSVRSEDMEGEKVFWFRKSISTGRALDQLAMHLGMRQMPLQLLKVDSSDLQTRISLRNDVALSTEVEDGAHLLIVQL